MSGWGLTAAQHAAQRDRSRGARLHLRLAHREFEGKPESSRTEAESVAQKPGALNSVMHRLRRCRPEHRWALPAPRGPGVLKCSTVAMAVNPSGNLNAEPSKGVEPPGSWLMPAAARFDVLDCGLFHCSARPPFSRPISEWSTGVEWMQAGAGPMVLCPKFQI